MRNEKIIYNQQVRVYSDFGLGRRTNILQKAEKHDALECNELGHRFSLSNFGFQALVKLKDRHNGESGSEGGDDAHPNMCKIEFAGRFTVRAGRFGDFG